MFQSTDPLHHHRVAGFRTRLPERVECRDTGAKQRCGRFRTQFIRDRDQGGRARDHHLRVAAIAGRSHNRLREA